MRRLIVIELSKELKLKMKGYESILKNCNFKMYTQLKYKKRAIQRGEKIYGAVTREFKLSILLKRKAISENC